MIVAFVNRDQQRVLCVDMGEEVDTLTKMTTRACDFINLLCEKLNWRWEPLKQIRPNTKLITFKELEEVFRNANNGN